jgi:hypothetical protein
MRHSRATWWWFSRLSFSFMYDLMATTRPEARWRAAQTCDVLVRPRLFRICRRRRAGERGYHIFAAATRPGPLEGIMCLSRHATTHLKLLHAVLEPVPQLRGDVRAVHGAEVGLEHHGSSGGAGGAVHVSVRRALCLGFFIDNYKCTSLCDDVGTGGVGPLAWTGLTERGGSRFKPFPSLRQLYG